MNSPRHFPVLFLLVAATIAPGLCAQSDAFFVKTGNPGTQASRLIVTTSAAGSIATVRVEESRLQLSTNGVLNVSTGAPGSPLPGDLYYSGGNLLFRDGSGWQTVATQTYGSSSFIQNQTGSLQAASYRISGTGEIRYSVAASGTTLYVTNSSTFAGSQYGLRAQVDGNTGTGSTFGGQFTVSGTATSTIGVNASASGASSTNTGVRGTASGGATSNFGIYGIVSGATTNNFGAYSSVSGAASNNFGLYGNVSGATSNFGVYANIGGAASANYGLYCNIAGASTSYGVHASNVSAVTTAYGVYANLSGACTTNYAVYGAASGATTNWAGYFAGAVTITGVASAGGTYSDVYTTRLYVTGGNVHVYGNEDASGQAIGTRTRLRVGNAWGFPGLYSETNSNGTNADLVLGAVSGKTRIGPDGDSTGSSQYLNVGGFVNVRYSRTGSLGQMNGWNPPSAGDTGGVWIENGQSEGGGFYADGDIAVIVSPGDPDLLRVYDEDGLPGIDPALRLDGIGRLGLGLGATTPTYRIELPNTADVLGRGLANAWVTYSSRRWKENIETIRDPLEKILRLRGVTFDWKPVATDDVRTAARDREAAQGKPVPDDPGASAPRRRDLGLIAEEVGEVVPEVVTFEENGTDASSVDYPRLVALLIEGIKAQQAQLEDQRRRIESLEETLGRR